MTETRVPEVIDALVALAPTAPGMPNGVRVVDGYPVGADVGTILSIGAEDPGDIDRADSAESTQEFAHAAGIRRNEAGQIRCFVSTADGAGDMKTARDQAYAVMAAIAALCRAGTSPFNLPNVWKAGVTDHRLYQDQTDEDGATALLTFTVTFTARI